MSSFQNPNYQPGAVIQNGYSPAVPPMHFQQQQQYSQQQAPQQLQQQQQEQQQQQQQQGLKNPIINKYMPPTSQNLSSISPSIVQNTIVQPNQQHQIQTQLLQSAGNLAPNLRQQLNGTITNGASGNSSRTSSPSLNSPLNNSNSPQLIQSKPQQPTPTTSSATGFPLTNINKNFAPQSVPILQPNLNSSMQNLSLGNPSAPPGMFPLLQSQASNLSQRPTNNFQSNFRTSALNNSPSVTHTVNPVSASLTTNQSIVSNQSLNIHNRPLQQNSPLPPNSSFGTSVIPTLTKSTSQTPQTQYTQQISNILPPAPTTTSISSQNIINNNQHQQANVPLNSQTNVMSSQPTQSARKPMYPSQKMLPQQFQQAYPQQQNIQQQPTFNGQPNTGPMQYQQQNQYPNQQPNSNYNQLSGGVTQQGFNRLWGQDTVDLMQNRHILSPATLSLPKIVLHNQFHESINCNPDIIRCTLTKIPESNSLLQKSRLPLGLLIHPFRDINSLPVIQCPNIVRCRLCRTYINPFVYFVDTKMWKCNLCYRVNELSEDFQFDPATKTYGDVTRRPEVRLSTIEFIAPSEYMLRPPQPAVYLFLFDVSIIAQQSGYLENVCNILSKHLEDMPGDARAQVGFIAYNSEVHFYSMADGFNQPHEMTLVDIDDPFLPCPDNLLVNLKECKELIQDLLSQLPKRFADTHDPGSALGAALQVAYKLMMASGGRITVFQTCLPNKGAGALQSREDPNNRSAKDIAHLNPATDFYKRHALECSGYQIAVDLFLLNQQYSDLATISGVSKHSGGSVHHFPLYQKTKPQHVDSFKQCFKRYLTRKIGFEAVMRIRCTRGLQVHTFHGNFFVRSTDLLSLPNVNPDAGYGMQISYEETLTDVKTICFQAALLYTNSEGERRIRVHTLCLPVTSSLPEVLHSADAEAVVGLLSKMAVDRSLTSNIADARDAFINATIDILSAFKLAQNLPSGQSSALMAPMNLGILPLYILSLLKHVAFRIGTSTRLDDRVAAMDLMKTLPLDHLIKYIYPEFYNIDCLFYNIQNSNEADDDDALPDPMRLQLSAEYLDSRSMFLLDSGTLIIIYVGLNVPSDILEKVLGVKSTAELPDYCYGLPSLTTSENDALKSFINNLNDDKPYLPTIQIIRDTSTAKSTFVEKLIDDRSESSLSYYEFLQHLRSQVK